MAKEIRFGILLIWALLLSISSYAQFPYVNSFKQNDATGIVMGGTPDPAYLTSGIDDAAGDGVLRLTKVANNLTGYAYINTSFPSKSGVSVEFEYFSYGGTGTTSRPDIRGDGISFFLFDVDEQPFEPGQFGGSLGFAQRSGNLPGMKGGFLAIGLDEFGNFGINSEGKYIGTNDGFKTTTNGNFSTAVYANGGVILRGGVGPNGERTGTGVYPFIDGKLTQPTIGGQAAHPDWILPAGSRFSISTDTRYTNPIQDGYRKVRMNIKKNTGSNTGFSIDVDIFVGGTGTPSGWVHVLQNVQYAIADNRIPDRFMAGFASSTGAATNYHEIRNLEINAAITLSQPTAVNDTETGNFNTPVDINALTNDDATANGGLFEQGTLDLDPTTPGIQDTYTVPGKGTFTVTALGVVTFTPVTGFTGSATANYTFSDDYGATSNVATIAVTINPPTNVPPVANDDAGTAKKGTTLVNINVRANDTDSDGTIDATSILLIDPSDNSKKTTVTIPGKGTYTVNTTTNTVDFVPEATFTGVSTIKYTIKDNNGAESNEATITITITDPKISLVKTAGTTPAGGYKLNDVITYTFKVKNEGDVALNTVSLTDNLAGVSVPVLTAGTDIGNDGILSVAEEWIYTAAYTITQVDVDAAKVSNTAKVTSKDPSNNDTDDNSGTSTTNDDPTAVPVVQTKGISLVKTAGTSPAGFKLNDVISYTFVVKNEGTVTLKDVVITDPLPGLSTITRTVGTGTTLAPGASWTYTATYTVKQSDVDAGKVTNQATVSSKDPSDTPLTQVKSDDPSKPGTEDPTEVPVTQTGKITLVKTASAAPAGGYKLGTQITYTFIVKNEGTVTLKDVVVTDPMPGLSAITRTAGTGTTLAPGASWTYTATYTITQADAIAGKVVNHAMVTSKDPVNNNVSDYSGTAENNNTPTEIAVAPNSPVANDDSAETEFNKEVKINLVGNDQPDGIPFELNSIEIVTYPAHGTPIINSNGTVTYKPNSGFTGTDVFTYRIKDQNGNYTNVATVTVKVTGFRIPNVFTPNGDGKNDTFVIVGVKDYNNAELIVFNRWGNEVFRDVNYQNTWDGGNLNEGTYYYILKLRKAGGEEVKKGWVLIKR